MDQVEGMGEKDMDQMSDWADLILTRFCPFAISLEQFPEILNECVFVFCKNNFPYFVLLG